MWTKRRLFFWGGPELPYFLRRSKAPPRRTYVVRPLLAIRPRVVGLGGTWPTSGVRGMAGGFFKKQLRRSRFRFVSSVGHGPKTNVHPVDALRERGRPSRRQASTRLPGAHRATTSRSTVVAVGSLPFPGGETERNRRKRAYRTTRNEITRPSCTHSFLVVGCLEYGGGG